MTRRGIHLPFQLQLQLQLQLPFATCGEADSIPWM
jgi:hypothetical protein